MKLTMRGIGPGVIILAVWGAYVGLKHLFCLTKAGARVWDRDLWPLGVAVLLAALASWLLDVLIRRRWGDLLDFWVEHFIPFRFRWACIIVAAVGCAIIAFDIALRLR